VLVTYSMATPISLSSTDSSAVIAEPSGVTSSSAAAVNPVTTPVSSVLSKPVLSQSCAY